MREHNKIGQLKLDGTPYLPEEMPANRSLLYGEIVRNEEMVLIRPDGSRVLITSSSAPLRDNSGKIVAVISMFDDITERKTMEQALKTFSQRLIEVQEEERKRIAYELHDDTAQYLALLKMQLNALLESGKIQNPEVLDKLRYLEKDSDRAFNDVRRYSHELRPVILERTGLTAALNQVVDDFNKIGELPVKMKVTGLEPELSEKVKLGLFRITQEALGNARKHSKASQAVINLTFQETRVEMTVNDNGTGFNLSEATTRASGKGSLGIMSMQERAKAIGARLKIDSKAGKGTSIKLEVELNAK
jgi:signal transduction histidine kinase